MSDTTRYAHGHIIAEFDDATSIGGVVVDSTTGLTMHIVDVDGEDSEIRLTPGDLVADTSALDSYGEDGNPAYDAALDDLTDEIGLWVERFAASRGRSVGETSSADGLLYYYFTAEDN